MLLFRFLKPSPIRRRRRIKKRDWEKAMATGRRFVDGEIISYLGHSYQLSITHDSKAPQGCRLFPRRFEVNIHNATLAPKILREEVRLEIRLWLKKRAKEKFTQRMDFWAKQLDVSYRQLILSSPRSRWGSCNAKNSIRLSWYLILAPLPLIDYVVAHELCHVAHKNHARGFWAMLGSVMPDYRTRRQSLKRLGTGLVI
jgi:predicted metal-dependent hydrolase